MAVVMVAMLAFGGTYAYFTATTDAKTGTALTGTVMLEKNTMATLQATGVVHGTKLISGDNNKVQVTDASNVDVYVFVTFSVTITKDGQPVTATVAELGQDETAANHDYAPNTYYLDVVGAEANGWVPLTEDNVFGKKVAVGDDDTIDVCTQITFYGSSQSTQTGDAAAVEGSLMGATITVTITAEAIQASSVNGTAFDSEQAAYDALKA